MLNSADLLNVLLRCTTAAARFLKTQIFKKSNLLNTIGLDFVLYLVPNLPSVSGIDRAGDGDREGRSTLSYVGNAEIESAYENGN